MIISIGSDHGGFDRKKEIIEYLESQNISILDRGCYDNSSCDYPVFAKKVALDIQKKQADFGILICTTGIGMCITANKFTGVRAALVTNVETATLTRQHNNSNVICLGAKFVSKEQAQEYVINFINEKFEGGRHLRRVELIETDGEGNE